MSIPLFYFSAKDNTLSLQVFFYLTPYHAGAFLTAEPALRFQMPEK